jgi:hypothetical protein
MGDDALALAAAVEAEDGEQEALGEGHGEEGELRSQMETDLAALGFAPDEISQYLESLALDAELHGISADPEGP